MNGPRAALLTPAGRGAVATLRVEGRGARGEGRGLWDTLPFLAASGKRLSEVLLNRIVFGMWGAESPEEVVVVRVDEHALEIHCHGGAAAVQRILTDLEHQGVTTVRWDDLLRESEGEFAAECALALARAPTERCAEILLDQANGPLAALLSQAPSGCPGLEQREAPDERRSTINVGPRASGTSLRSSPGHPIPATEAGANMPRVQGLEAPATKQPGCGLPNHEPRIPNPDRWAAFGRHLTEPWNVVLTGRPNVGKSSLLNALLGYGRAIVSELPGTTRDVVTGETAIDGWPVRLSDTAGLRETSQPLEAAGIERARRSLELADLRILVLDRSQPRTADDERILADWPDALVVATKCDLASAWPMVREADRGATGSASASGGQPSSRPGTLDPLEVSAVSGLGIDTLLKAIVARLVPELPPEGAAIPFTERQVRRIQALSALAQDVPA